MTPVEQMVFDSMSESLFIDEAQFRMLMEGWTLTPDYRDSQLCGVVLTKGPELHFVTSKMRQITRADLRNYVLPLIQTYGYAMTRCPKKDVRQARFNLLIGFKQVGEEGIDYLFRIDTLKERKSCQQSQ